VRRGSFSLSRILRSSTLITTFLFGLLFVSSSVLVQFKEEKRRRGEVGKRERGEEGKKGARNRPHEGTKSGETFKSGTIETFCVFVFVRVKETNSSVDDSHSSSGIKLQKVSYLF